MRILTVSDKVEPVLYGPYIRQRVGVVDLILACGDLPYYYLEFIVSSLDAPMYYVHGNHDLPVSQGSKSDLGADDVPVGWATDLHMRTVEFRGLLLAGLEGCRRYTAGTPYQYTEREVSRQAFWLGWALRRNRFRYGRHLDVLITHSPPYSIHDAKDVAHTGFYTYLALLRHFRPILMVHGHYHVYNRNIAMDSDYEGVHIVNTYGYRIIELARLPGDRGWELVSTTL